LQTVQSSIRKFSVEGLGSVIVLKVIEVSNVWENIDVQLCEQITSKGKFLMAKLLPPYIDKSCKSTGEKMIFEIFKNNSFTKDWIVLHSSQSFATHSAALW
jgi:hypothetical protein